MTEANTGTVSQWQLDVSTDGTTWTKVNGLISGTFPGITGSAKDSSTFDNNGWSSSTVTSNSWSLDTEIEGQSDQDKNIDPAMQLILGTVGKLGGDAMLYCRWGRRDGWVPFQGYTGRASVTVAPGNSAWDDIYTTKVTFAGSGEATLLTSNPWATPSAPTISAVTPASQGTGQIVFITGSGFTGATAVDFGATAATEFAVRSDTEIAATLPTGSAGSVAITVVNGTGTSAAFTYTRAA